MGSSGGGELIANLWYLRRRHLNFLVLRKLYLWVSPNFCVGGEPWRKVTVDPYVFVNSPVLDGSRVQECLGTPRAFSLVWSWRSALCCWAVGLLATTLVLIEWGVAFLWDWSTSLASEVREKKISVDWKKTKIVYSGEFFISD